jgi:hypothetical protein
MGYGAITAHRLVDDRDPIVLDLFEPLRPVTILLIKHGLFYQAALVSNIQTKATSPLTMPRMELRSYTHPLLAGPVQSAALLFCLGLVGSCRPQKDKAVIWATILNLLEIGGYRRSSDDECRR